MLVLVPKSLRFILPDGAPKLRWLNRFVELARKRIRNRSVITTAFVRSRFQFAYEGPRKVFRPRFPPLGIVFARGKPVAPTGVLTSPVPSSAGGAPNGVIRLTRLYSPGAWWSNEASTTHRGSAGAQTEYTDTPSESDGMPSVDEHPSDEA